MCTEADRQNQAVRLQFTDFDGVMHDASGVITYADDLWLTIKDAGLFEDIPKSHIRRIICLTCQKN